MPGNAWTARRRVHRRPPVCKSKPRPEDESGYPPFLGAAWDWIKAPPPFPSTETSPFAPYANFPIGTTQYPISGVTDQGATYSGSITLNVAPTNSSYFIAITSGPYSGQVLSGTCTGFTPGVPYTAHGLLGAAGGWTGNMHLRLPP